MRRAVLITTYTSYGKRDMTLTNSTTQTNPTLTPFRGDHVGSFLRPERLKKARLQHENGEITDNELRLIEDEEITKLVEQQKSAGLQSVTDGELRRKWWHFDFLGGFDGVEFYETDKGLQFKGVETRAHGIRVTGKIKFTGHYMIEHFKFLQSVAGDAVAKFTIPSPNMLLFRASFEDGVYETDEELPVPLQKRTSPKRCRRSAGNGSLHRKGPQ